MKRSQSGMNAAVLVAIISALIILYILFLPSDERLPFIGDNTSVGGGANTIEYTLLEENEIIMQHIGQDEIDHDLPSVNLFTSTEGRTLREENSIYVKNGIADKADRSLEFKVGDPDNIKNMLISFDVKKPSGRLIITLNDHSIFDGEIFKVNADPIKVPKDYIGRTNILNIEVSGVGMAFWKTNEYTLENFKITADYTDTSAMEAEIRFVVSSAEAANAEKATLKFIAECTPETVGKLDILMNSHEIFTGVPDCGLARPLDFSTAYFLRGENTLTFQSTKGKYLIDQIKITTELAENPSYTYYFTVDEDQYKEIMDEDAIANLTLFFVDDREDKEGEIIVNGDKLFMTRHSKFEWSEDISEYIDQGSNSLKIFPETKLEVRKIAVTIEKD